MSERTTALGTPVATFEWEGRSYSFGLITEGVMARMEAKLFEHQKAPLVASRGDMDPEHYARRLDALFDRREKGEFAFESPAMLDHLESPRGAVQMIALLLDADEDTVLSILQSDRRDELNSAFRASKLLSMPKAPERAAHSGPKATAQRVLGKSKKR